MDMTDQEIDELIASAKRVAIHIVRPLALGLLAFVLSWAQRYFSYADFAIGILVFTLAASSFAPKMAYAIIFYLGFLVLLPPEFATAAQKSVGALASKLGLILNF